MHWLYTVVQIFPFFAVPAALAAGQIGIFFWRKKSKYQYPFWLLALIFLSLSVVWAIYRGDLHSNDWVRRYVEDPLRGE
ncbi:hypothetical protein WDW86_13640 [Bdellovibrionota bacterium FG-2]